MARARPHPNDGAAIAIGTAGSLVVLIIAVFLGPETAGKVLTADIEVLKLAEIP